MLRIAQKNGRFHIEGHRGEAGFFDVMKWQFTSRRSRCLLYTSDAADE